MRLNRGLFLIAKQAQHLLKQEEFEEYASTCIVLKLVWAGIPSMVDFTINFPART
jgi:hypothetical protein